MINKGKRQDPFLGEIDVVEFEQKDFDFSVPFEDLDWNTKANFMSFIKIGILPREKTSPLYLKIVGLWNYYKEKTT